MPYTLEQCGWLRRSELDDLHRGDLWEHEHSDAKKMASAQFGTDRTPEALFARVPGGKPARKRQHLRLDGGHYR